MVLVHHADGEVFDFAAKGVPEHDQLDQGHDHGHDNESRAAPEPAKVAFDNGENAMHSAAKLFAVVHERAAVGGGALERVAQLVSGVVDENIIQGSALNGEGGDGNTGAPSGLHQLDGRARSVVG